MTRFVLKIIVAIVLVLIGYRIGGSLESEFKGGGWILLITVIGIQGTDFIYANRRRIWLAIKSYWLALRGKYIRFSMSYQYIIKVDGKYLLVKNSNPNWDWYQHVGGKYKTLPETQMILKQMEATDDLKMKSEGFKKGDLAIFLPAKNALKFLDWFDSKKDREISHWREFYEELLGGKSGIQLLSKENFPYVNYRFVKSVRTPLKRAPMQTGWNCWEILQYDVLELLPTEQQYDELLELKLKGDTDYIKWASNQLINNLGYDGDILEKRYKIGEHTKWVLNTKWSKE
jgi:hypothetical protein